MPDVIGPEAVIGDFIIGEGGEPEPEAPEAHASIVAIRERPPLRLSVNVVSPSGSEARWGYDDPNPINVPKGLTFSTVRPGGFERLALTLGRKPEQSYPDTAELLETITVRGPGGAVAWQGRVEKTPDTSSYQSQETIEAVGWQAHLEDDNSAREIYVDRELAKWEPPPLERKLGIIASADEEDPSVGTAVTTSGKAGVITQLSGPWERTRTSEAFYDAAGIPIGKLIYYWERASTVPVSSTWATAAVLTVSAASPFFSFDREEFSTAARPGPAESTLAATVSDRTWGMVYLITTAAGGASGTQYPVYWTTLAVYGEHGLALYGENGLNLGVLASDAVGYAVGKWAPRLSYTTGPQGTIQPSSFPIPQLVFLEPTTVAEILKQATRFELLDWAVWESFTPSSLPPAFYMNPQENNKAGEPLPSGERGRAWRARVGPSQLQEAGPQVSRIYNGVVVQWTDPSGKTRVVGPPGSGAETEAARLLDTSSLNTINEAGELEHRTPIRRWAKLQMGTTTLAGAEKVGEVFLRETSGSTLELSGQAALVGHVEDDKGTWWPAWACRAGDTVSFVDASLPGPRRVVSTSYSDEDKTNTITLSVPPESLTALLERMSVVLTNL